MQRSSYAPPPANSPPLHHPVPQHVSTVPMMRSPPPPQSSSSYTSSPYGGQSSQPAQGAAGPYASTLGGFMNDPTTQMGLQLGQGAMKVGQDYIDQNVRRQYISPRTDTESLFLGRSIFLSGLPQTILRCHNTICPSQITRIALSFPTSSLVEVT